MDYEYRNDSNGVCSALNVTNHSNQHTRALWEDQLLVATIARRRTIVSGQIADARLVRRRS